MNVLPLVLVALAQPPQSDRFARWEKEIARIEKRLLAHPPKPGGVFFFGSSSIRLWNLKKSFPDGGYVNVGFGGSTIPDCTHFAPRIVLPYKPKSIVFYAGDNDIASKRKPEQVFADFKAFVSVIHKDLPECKIHFLAIKPSVARRAQIPAQMKANGLIKEYCGKNKRLMYLDTAPLLLGPDGNPIPMMFAKDGLHLSAAGYAKWTALVSTALSK